MLHSDALADCVQRHYGIQGNIEPVPRGRANNYIVSHQGTRWLLKVFQPQYTQTRIERAADFVSFIVRAGYPAQEFVPSRDGDSVIKFEGRAAVLIPWIDGDTPEPNTVSTLDALRHIGALCGRVHRLGAGYPRATTLEYAGSKRGVAEKRAGLRRLAEQSSDAEIVDEIGVRTAILSALGEELGHSQQVARRGVIHGDFSGSHVVFQADRAVGVIDVMGERYLPGWELMRAFFQSIPPVDKPPATIEASWRAYLAGYTSEYPIQAREVAIAYDSYLLQLTSSTYGLRHPLDDGLRAFGRWRTNLAHHLAEHRREFRDMTASHSRSSSKDYS